MRQAVELSSAGAKGRTWWDVLLRSTTSEKGTEDVAVIPKGRELYSLKRLSVRGIFEEGEVGFRSKYPD